MELVTSARLLKRNSPCSSKCGEKQEKVAASNNLVNDLIRDRSGNHDSVSNKDVGVTDVVKNKNLKEKTQFEAKLTEDLSLEFPFGITIPFEEDGNVLQFLMFCSTFGENLGLAKGQAITVLEELFPSEPRIKVKPYFSSIAMKKQLLELIFHDKKMCLPQDEINTLWFNVLGDFLLQSKVMSDDEFPPETFKAGVSEYYKMDSSKKLKLLNFLCDESLSTMKMRDYIDSALKGCEAKIKEAKQKAKAASAKVKKLRKKMRSQFPKKYVKKSGVPLNIEEHSRILAQLIAEIEEAHEQMLEANKIASIKEQGCDAVRIGPIVKGHDGTVLWKVKCFDLEPRFLLQDVGTFDNASPHETWLDFEHEQDEEIEEYISSKKEETKKNANVVALESATSASSSEVIVPEQS